ncbi:MAG: hypothetical protein MJZ81_11410 [Bacteroidales bacterium]|nr:hypothetical protein [Bacteroidales bacterium]
MTDTAAILLCAGNGTCMGGASRNKVAFDCAGVPVVRRIVELTGELESGIGGKERKSAFDLLIRVSPGKCFPKDVNAFAKLTEIAPSENSSHRSTI